MKRFIVLIALCLVMPAAHAEIFISNALVNFNDTPVDGFGKSTSIYLQNLNIKATQVTVSNNDCYDNFYITNECDVTLEQKKTCNIAIRFQPYQFGHLSCSLTIQDSLGDSGRIEVTGRGVQPK
jgi:hypothetical protein